MVKPSYLWALCKTCSDSKWLGDICRCLGGQEVPLDFGQRQAYSAIMMDSDWMDERIRERREKDAEKHRQWRERRDKARRKQVVAGVLEDIANDADARPASPHVTGDAGDVTASRNVTSHPSPHPSVRPSVRPSIRENTNRTDADAVPRAHEAARARKPAPGSASESESGSASASESAIVMSNMEDAARGERPNPWKWEDDEIRWTTDWDTRSILSFALGKGAWAKAVRQAGDEAVRELFVQFRAEVRAGEVPENPAAAFTRRLARDLGVDFSKQGGKQGNS